ncbi:185c0014-42a1-4bc6-9030-ae45f251e986-CDS [Sclerotinia trifoliorum]|uniref:185c0014-42a1-4bc6-9030-ae45f251e986-CDS n=1 Tax=Sclerotinia trifoliorum TaxID=28548 RepID=A0A8H2VYT3_9HELO|nr:185c0014-42a1-4bc6-9030-ae45f251e986-CDS [Sclerotinia trifoliorum]
MALSRPILYFSNPKTYFDKIHKSIMSAPGPLFIIGTGPMIGSHIPRLFATHTYTADVTDTPGLTNALQKALKEVGSPEVVIYNAARVSYGKFGEYNEEDILEDFKIPNLGLYTTAKILLPALQALGKKKVDSHPALFVTSSPIVYQPFAPVFSLSMAKAAQANLVRGLIELVRDEVHVALVMVGGPVGEEEPVNNPEYIASKFWELWEQNKGERVGELLVQ